MSVVVVRPDGYVLPDSSSITGGASIHGVTSDDSDASYVSKARYAPAVRFEMGSPTKPANSVTKSVMPGVRRSSQSSGTTKLNYWVVRNGLVYGSSQTLAAGTTAATVSGTTFTNGDLTQAELDTLQVHCQVDASSSADARIYEVYLDVTFAEQPTITVDDVVDGTSSSVTWAYTAGTDGGPQAWYRAWLTADVGGATVYDTGITYGAASSVTATGLTPADYTWHVQAAAEIHPGQGHWSDEETVASVIPPQTTSDVDTIVATPDPLQAVVEVQVEIDTATDTAESVEIERLAAENLTETVGEIETGTGGVPTGWTLLPGGASSAVHTIEAGGESGNFGRLAVTIASGEDNVNVSVDESFACEAGDLVIVTARIKSAVTSTAFVRLAGGYLSTSPAAETSWLDTFNFIYVDPTISASWATVRLTEVVPADVQSFKVALEVFPGASGGTATLDYDLVTTIISADGWESLRNIPGPDGDSLTAFDFEAPPGTPLHYRARAENAGGAVGQWVYSEPVEWDAEDGVWFKPLGRPDLTMQLCLAERPTLSRPRQSVVIPILGSPHRVVRSDVLNSTEWDLLLETETAAEAASFLALCESGAELLLQFPPEYDMLGPHMWVSVLGVEEAFQSPVLGIYYRVWRLRVVEIDTP